MMMIGNANGCNDQWLLKEWSWLSMNGCLLSNDR